MLEADTVWTNIGTQLVANSNFAPNKKRPFPAFKFFSRASQLQDLKVSHECTGIIFLLIEVEISSFLTTTSRMPTGIFLRYSYSYGRRAKNLWSDRALFG